jgi:hypothetical protein
MLLMGNQWDFGFMNKGVFEGLEKYKKSPPLTPKKKEFDFLENHLGKQIDAFSDKVTIRTRVGTYFEYLSQAFYGGEIGKKFEIKSLHPRFPSRLEIKPDLFSSEEGWVREIKSVSRGNCVRLMDYQIAEYTAMQLSPDYLRHNIPPPEIIFDVFKYGKKCVEMRCNGMNLEEITFWFSSNINYMISLPFNVIAKIHSSPSQMVYRFNGTIDSGGNIIHCAETKIKSRTLNLLLAYPRYALNELGINNRNLKITQTHSPDNMKVDGKKINPFPILIVKDISSQKKGWNI